ncbi:protein croquemort-like [Cimex lectularius]|uniref:Protein croquemort n=1 Tax=Cimex lectularius TaxID=79782 RepID=A0A8I6TFS9_CIMLE|nr:protein croquemort-like [Cimex lectularius]
MRKNIFLEKVILLGFGGVLFVLFCTVSIAWPLFFFSQLKEQLVLTNQSKSYTLWKDTPIPMYLEIYMFNWTNPEETLKKGKTPHFVEMGPYVFSETHKKVDVNWNDDNETVTFKQIRQWKFIPGLSNGKLDDEVTNVNVVALTIANMVKKYIDSKTIEIPVDKLFSFYEKKVYIKKPVRKLLFDGYSDELLNIAEKLKHIIKVKIPFDKFGWFYSRNNSADYDGVFSINTGMDCLYRLGLLEDWNYNTHTDIYSGICGQVSGTLGELWPYDASKKEEIEIFANDICSSIKLKRNSTQTIQGVEGILFEGDETVFDNGQIVRENACYCSNSNFACPPPGTRDISTCRYGAPAFISYPHFYLGDKYYHKAVSGMKPDPQKHKFYIVLDKTMSIPLEVHARLQINILTENSFGLKFFEDLPTAYMPMIWFNQKAVITPTLSSQIKSISFFDDNLEYIFIGLALFGLILTLLGIFLWGRRVYIQEPSPSTSLLCNSDSTENIS